MKPILVLFLALVTSFNSFANDKLSYLVNADKNKVMVIDLNKTFGNQIKVAIFDKNGTEVFNETFKSKANARKYNLEKLNIGTYTVVIEDHKKVSYQIIHISKNSLLVDNGIKESYLPTFKAKGDVWSVDAFNTFHTPVSISITDQYGHVLINQKFEANHVKKQFNVKKLLPGQYRIAYIVNNREYSSTITKS